MTPAASGHFQKGGGGGVGGVSLAIFWELHKAKLDHELSANVFYLLGLTIPSDVFLFFLIIIY